MQTPPLHVGADAPIGPRLDEEIPQPVPPGSPRRIRWARRRKALHRFWQAFRKDQMGMVGLVILVFFIGVAIFAIFADTSGTRITEATGERLQPPSWDYPLGTDNYGRSVLTLTIQGAKVSLLVGLTATVITMIIGAAVGLVAGYRGGVDRHRADAHHRLGPGDPLARPRDLARLDLRSVAVHHHPGHRSHDLAEHRPDSSAPRCCR